MPYNEAHSELRDHPKTKRLKRMLKTSLPATIGHLQCLWWWVMDYAPNGDLSKFNAGDIAEGAEWEGDEDVFLDALLTCNIGEGGFGFLEKTTDGKLIVHDWWQYGGKLIVKRWTDAFRKRTSRTPTVAEMMAADLPLSPVVIAEFTAQTSQNQAKPEADTTSVGNPSEVLPTSVSGSTDRAGREAKRSVAERSEEQQQRSEEESTRGETEPNALNASGVPAAAADAYGTGNAMPKVEATAPTSSTRFALPPGENPRVWVDKMLAVSPKHWASELQKRYTAANAKSAIRSEWPWKARLLTDWLNGDEPAPDAPPSSKPPARVQSPQATEEARRLADEAVNAAKEASLPKIADIKAQLAEKMRISGSAPPSANKPVIAPPTADYSVPNNSEGVAP